MKKKIGFIIPELGKGGSERVFFHLLNNLSRDKYELYLILICREGEYFKELREDIVCIFLNKSRIRYSLFSLKKIIKNLDLDIIFSTLVELNFLIGCFLIPFLDKKYKFIARESHILSMTYKGGLKKYLKEKSMNNFNKIIVQSNDMLNDIEKNFEIKKECILVNNPIDSEYIDKKLDEKLVIPFKNTDKNILCVSRLYYQKGIDLLIPIMKNIKDKKVKLYLMGDGPEREKLEIVVKKNDLQKQVIFLGNQGNPYIYIKKADLIVLPSRYEGFSNTLLEANYCGKYCLVNNCLGGVNEIIENKINGEIIDFTNSKVSADKIEEVLKNLSLINKEKIKENILRKYNLKKIINIYEKIIDEVE